ncbi:M20/M25/M40 family metallo-hydrolase [Paenarthrobacter sp. NPDC090520]|uniref:M20/M25/M40 family metallo-hydrolase n=1 Tax=Paenarthrobacter sp. NPDC090520 TaxID=3364382 RepID=UPI003802B541
MAVTAAEKDPLDLTGTIARDLIRFDTSNYGDGRSRGEDQAAGYVEAFLQRLGVETTCYEPEPGRTSVVARVRGRNPGRGALLAHGHLDVVPAETDGWHVDPFGGEIHDGVLWGRGAVDMKNMNAMILASLEAMLSTGRTPDRDLVLAFLADEEDGGRIGAHHLVDNHPGLFAGATEAISEVGGYSIDIRGRRAYLVQTAEKSLIWLRLTATGEPGHGSRVIKDTAVLQLAEAIARLGNHEWPIELTRTTEALVSALASLLGTQASPGDAESIVLASGASGFIHGSLKTTANTTVIRGGAKHNVIPAYAEALVDVRTLPGGEDRVIKAIQSIVGTNIRVEVLKRLDGIEAPNTGRLMETMSRAILDHDPGATVIPYLMPGGTDNKAFAKLGIAGYGFVPLQLPPSFDFAGMFHNENERVPLESLSKGTSVLTQLLLQA